MFMPTKITCIIELKQKEEQKYLKRDVPGCDGGAKLVDGLLYIGVRINIHACMPYVNAIFFTCVAIAGGS